MKISKLKTSSTSTFDLAKFTAELQELSDRNGIKLVSIGALRGLEGSGMYLAIWESAKKQ